MYRILAVNPGSTSTKLALFHAARGTSANNASLVCGETIRHDEAALAACGAAVWDQFEMRWQAVSAWAERNAGQISAAAAVGGLLRPLAGGVYAVNQRMLDHARANLRGEHASNLGCALAHLLAHAHGCEAYIVDPVSVDELGPLARYSGHPAIERRSLAHALNIHAAARRAAEQTAIPFDESCFVIAHLGGGISVAPVDGGRIVDVNDAASDGPFSPERTGGLPLQPFLDLCFSGQYSESDLRRLVMGRGGLIAYLGANSAIEVERRIAAGDQRALEVYQAMAYQISKEIGAMATVLCGRLHGILLTGGLAHSAMLTGWIEERVRSLGRVIIYPGEDEMQALADGVLRVLRGQSAALDY